MKTERGPEGGRMKTERGPEGGRMKAGDELPTLTIPITRTLIVAGALASRDYQDVHHDTEAAQQKGSPDIFMNILTTNGLVGRYLTDHFGPRCTLRKVAIRLGAPNYPGDTMVLSGTVTEVTDGTAVVRVVGANGLGHHVTGTVTVRPPGGHGMSVHRPDSLGGRAAIAGIGATEFSKDSGRSELTLAVEAVRAALDDAGLTPADVDGLVTFTMDTNPEITVAQAAGIGELSFFSRVHYGGGAACATVQQAALAVATGIAEVVVCYRAFNERSGRRFGSGVQQREPSAEGAALGWNLPFGLLTPASWVAMAAQRYLHTYGLTPDAFGHGRGHRPPPRRPQPGRVLLRQAHHPRRPRRLPLDRGAAAAAGLLPGDGRRPGDRGDLARAGPRAAPPAGLITAAAQGAGRGQEQMTSFYRDDLTGLPEMNVVARQLWRTAALTPADIDVAILYDHFTPFVLMQLEEFGFCAPGEAADFVAADTLPLNTHGGQLGEAYLHGMNGIAEAVRQLRGTSVNQAADPAHVLVTAGTGVPTSGLILGADGVTAGSG